MDCDKAREEFSALLDDELTPEARAAVDAHLAECSSCLRELEAFRRVNALYAGLPRVPAPEDLEDRVRGLVSSKRVVLGTRRRWHWAPVAAAAAGLVIVAGGAWQFMLRDTQFGDSFQMATESMPENAPQADVADPMALRRQVDESAAGFAMKAEPLAQEPASADDVQLFYGEHDAYQDGTPERENRGFGGRAGGGFGGGGGAAGGQATVPQISSTHESTPQLGERARIEAGTRLADGGGADRTPARAKPTAPAAAAPPAMADVQHENGVLQEQMKGLGYLGGPVNAPEDTEENDKTMAQAPEPTPADRFRDIEQMGIQSLAGRNEAANDLLDGIVADAPPQANAPAPAPPAEEPIPRMAQRAPGEMAVVTETRTLRFQDGVWTQSEYRGETTVPVTRDSEAWNKLMARDESLMDFASLEAPVIFRESGVWYRLETKAEE